VAPPIVWAGGFVRRVIGVGELVILGLGNPSEGDAEALKEPDPVALEAAVQVPVKELVVSDLVGRDVATDILQNWLLHAIAQRRVV
jgi:hypothetical protein